MPDEENKDDKKDPSKVNPQQEPPSGTSNDGQGKKEEDNLPEKFKGKSATDIAKAYVELERKLGENSGEVSKVRQQVEVIGKVISNNPDLKKMFDDEVERLSGKKPEDSKAKGKEGNPVRDDTRIATETLIINSFEEKYGINLVDGEKKKELYNNIGSALADMLDPSGKKEPGEIIESIPLDRLPKYLENAYRLATIGDQTERARSQAFIEKRQNDEASWGSIPSSGGKGKGLELTAKERETARKLGVSEDDYKKEKEKLLKGE